MNAPDRNQVIEGRNTFSVDIRDTYFQLFEVLNVQNSVLKTEMFSSVDRETCVQLIEVAKRFSEEYLGKSYQVADREGCNHVSNVEVRVPEIYHEIWQKFRQIGLCSMSAPLHYGGYGTPYVVNQAIYSLIYGADPSFSIYPGFNIGAVYLLEEYGSIEQKLRYSQALSSAEMTAALVMTESDAGSDTGQIRTKAIREKDGRYRIEGSKIFISSGMHNLTENIVYFVLARAELAPAGTTGLSCFLVPRIRENGEHNNVFCDRVEDKMGLKGNATAQLSFGGDGACYGTLLGEVENRGLSQVIKLMNLSRIATGTYALGICSAAYYSTVEYAKTRIQGTSIRNTVAKNAPRLPIVEHLDVKRMLLDMKCRVEGLRSLVLRTANYSTLASSLADKVTPEEVALRKRYSGLVDLLTPIVKAYSSDQAFRVCETAIQVHGGYGYIKDFPVEQYARDVKIMSIWEGTNYIQSTDLIRSKLSLGKKSRLFQFLKDEILVLLRDSSEYPEFRAEFSQLESALSSIEHALGNFGEWLSSGHMEQIYLMATRFLDAFGDFLVGWLLLSNAVKAHELILEKSGDYDEDFYQGKIIACKHFYKNSLSLIPGKLNSIASVDFDIAYMKAESF